MRLFIDGDEVTVEELRQRLNDLDCGEFDGGSFELITLDHISEVGDMYFETEKYSVYG
jgi:hypothetical protein